jgi:carboxylate-amine ligase
VSLQALREEVARRAFGQDARILAAGAHPTARGEGQPIVPEPRYEAILAELGADAYRQLVCGVHVHVGMPSREACLRALEGVVHWLPTLLALSANSPYAEGVDSGARSARAARLAELPHAGPPPVLRTWADWEAATAGVDYTRLWWDARPHPRYGTLEVRVADQQTDVRRTAALAALVQALVAAVGEREHEPYDRTRYRRRRLEAACRPPAPEEVDALRVLVEPAARKLGGWELAEILLAGRPEAERQLEIGARGGIGAVLEDLAARSDPVVAGPEVTHRP